MTETPEYFKWRCTECGKEPKHTLYAKGNFFTVGECQCKARELEMVPMTKQMYEKRLSDLRRQG